MFPGMFRFRLGRIPVGVHFSHLLFSGLIALSWKPTQIRPEWPDVILGDPAHPEYLLTLVLFVAAWMAIIFVSVLVHELVHHLQEASGQRPACPAERERDAYALQERWLRRFGGSLERDFGIAPIFVLVAGVCAP